MGFSFENKRHVGLLVVLVVLIWLVFPFLFKAFMFWMEWVGVDLETFATYGPVGDIYGSLNTLFTSATLAFVIYSTILQRQANKDARDAMADQLQQARDATAKQLRQARQALKQQLEQARDATDQQINNAKELATIQLEQARDSTSQQLVLAQASHEAQIRETKYAIFSNLFYALLEQKHSRYLSLQTKKNNIQYMSQDIFSHVNQRFASKLMNEWNDVSLLKKEDLETGYFNTMFEISNTGNYSEIFAYFKIFIDLYELINRSGLEEDEKKYFKNLLRNSITAGENAGLFWIGAFRSEISHLLHRECLLSLGYDEFLMPFATKFYRKECFVNKLILQNWDRFANEETPA